MYTSDCYFKHQSWCGGAVQDIFVLHLLVLFICILFCSCLKTLHIYLLSPCLKHSFIHPSERLRSLFSAYTPHYKFPPRCQRIESHNQCRAEISLADQYSGVLLDKPVQQRSTPSHIVISVADLEVKFNFPLQQQFPLAPWKSHFRIQKPFPPSSGGETGYYNL